MITDSIDDLLAFTKTFNRIRCTKIIMSKATLTWIRLQLNATVENNVKADMKARYMGIPIEHDFLPFKQYKMVWSDNTETIHGP